MIFRRFGRHVSEHDWFAVFIDLGVLVLGIFLGLQVTNWNEERLSDRELDTYLQSLATEFANSQRILENHVAWQESVITSLQLALEALEGRDLSAEESRDVYRGLAAGAWPPPYPGKREVLFEMQSTGMLQRLPQGDFKSVLMEILALERVSQRFYDREVAGLTAADFSSAIVSFGQMDEGNPRTDGLLIITDIDWEAAREDPDFRLRILQIHAAFKTTMFSKKFYASVDEEVLRFLAEMGFEPSSNWLLDFMERTEPEMLNGTEEEKRPD